MRSLTNIVKGCGILKTVGTRQSKEFLLERSTNRNIWFSKRRYAY